MHKSARRSKALAAPAQAGCGRVDLPGADPDAMFRSLRQLRQLPEDLVLYPGHGYSGDKASMGQVQRLNPYLQIEELAEWQRLMGGR